MGEPRWEVVIEKLLAGGMGLARLGHESKQGSPRAEAGSSGGGEVVMVPRVAVGERVAIAVDRSRKPARHSLNWPNR